MTDTLHSPHHKLPASFNRKRSGYDDEDGPSITQSSKRSRADQEAAADTRPSENFSPQLGVNVSCFGDPQRRAPDFSSALAIQQQIEMISKVYQAQIESMKAQHQSQLDSKNRELAHLMTVNNRLIEECKKTSQDQLTVVDENKLLKKAVQIQDHRQKELTAQCAQYEQIIKAAAEHIQKLERENRMLIQELQQSNGRGFPHHPPDVF